MSANDESDQRSTTDRSTPKKIALTDQQLEDLLSREKRPLRIFVALLAILLLSLLATVFVLIMTGELILKSDKGMQKIAIANLQEDLDIQDRAAEYATQLLTSEPKIVDKAIARLVIYPKIRDKAVVRLTQDETFFQWVWTNRGQTLVEKTCDLHRRRSAPAGQDSNNPKADVDPTARQLTRSTEGQLIEADEEEDTEVSLQDCQLQPCKVLKTVTLKRGKYPAMFSEKKGKFYVRGANFQATKECNIWGKRNPDKLNPGDQFLVCGWSSRRLVRYIYQVGDKPSIGNLVRSYNIGHRDFPADLDLTVACIQFDPLYKDISVDKTSPVPKGARITLCAPK